MQAFKSELPSLNNALVLYKALTGKTWGDIMAKEAREWAFALYAEFSKLSPAAGAITAGAMARGYAMGRKANALTGAMGGISVAAFTRAKILLDGEKSDYFRVDSANGSPRLRRVRFSGFKRKGERRLLMGGRFGNKFASSSLKAAEVEKEQLAAARAKNPGVKRLNERAVATAIEIAYRARAARGHLMGNQWLPSVYKGRKNAMIKTGPLISRASNGGPLGRIDFASGPDGELKGVTLSGFVPGTTGQAEKHGIAATVEALRVADRMTYVQRKLRENAEKAFKK